LSEAVLTIARQKFQIRLSIFVVKENRGAIVAALRDLMGITGAMMRAIRGHKRKILCRKSVNR